MHFGCDYYPEHWPEERWEKDAQMMREAGFNVVRMAEFAWSKMEPEEGKFDFSWLDRVIEILAKNKIKAVLGTPTAAPPAWLVKKHPEILRVDEKRIRSSFGGRREYCPNSRIYQDYSRRIVEEMARHYRENENVIGWQIDNEFGGDRLGGLCFCDSCLKEFRRWLKEKYHSLDRLNKEWGTCFWSQTYTSWDQIPLPYKTETYHNPSLLLDYRRFISESYIKYQNLQINILRSITPNKFITHNFMGLFNKIDYFKLAKPLDFVSWDNYPRLGREPSPYKVAFSHELTRSLKKKSFWVMEEQSGPAGGEFVSSTPHPGEIRLWTYQAIGYGAEGVLYFRWRTCLFGQEEYWHGILDHNGNVNRRYEEILKVGKELTKLDFLKKRAPVNAKVGILYSYDIDWAFQIQPHNQKLNYQEHLLKFYRPLWRKGLRVDILDMEENLSGYRLIIAPNLFLLKEETCKKLAKYVEGGGYLLLTFRSGVKNWNNVVTEKTLPGALSELAGIEVEEYSSLPSDEESKVEIVEEEIGNKTYSCSAWCDVIRPKKAKPFGLYVHGYFKGKPALTINRYNTGYVLYIGTIMEDKFYYDLLTWLLARTKISSSLEVPEEVELIRRPTEKGDVLFFLNHGEKEKRVKLNQEYKDLLSGKTYREFIDLKEKEVACLMERS